MRKDPGIALSNLWYALHPETRSSRLAAMKNPGAVVIGSINLLFDGDYLHWKNGEATVVKWPAIAGATPWNEDSFMRYYTSTEDFSKMKGWGPPPEGQYSVRHLETAKGTPSQTVDKIEDSLEEYYRWYEKFGMSDWWREASKEDRDAALKRERDTDWYLQTLNGKIAWGRYRSSFKKLPGTRTYGRGGFYIHGGEVAGSHGCIDLLNHMDDFAKLFT